MPIKRKVRERFPVAPPLVRGRKYHDWLESQIKLYELALNGIADAVMVALSDGRMTYANPAAIQMMGLTATCLLQSRLCEHFVAENGDPQTVPVQSILGDAGSLRHQRAFLRGGGGSVIPVELNVTKLTIDETVVRIVVTCRDMRWELEQRRLLETQALTDRLTGCRNRYWFEAHYAKCIDEAKRDATGLGLVFIDLDNFKTVNDQSFIFGDELIRNAAKTIRKVLRPEDSLVRLGGDEFVLTTRNVPLPSVLEISNRILEALRAMVVFMPRDPQVRFPLTASIGISVLESDHPRLVDLLDCAQEAKRLAKLNGKNCIYVMP